MRLTFCDPNQSVAAALSEAFADVPDALAIPDTFENVIAAHGPFDALVSPANSFGIMDGGVDAAITAYFGTDLQARVQKQILEEWGGEQPVGTCMPVDAGCVEPPMVKWLLHAPTMRVPSRIVGTANVYQAFRAVLLSARHGVETWTVEVVGDLATGYGRRDAIQSVLCPGMGTLTGGLTPENAAAQMRAAWDSLERTPSFVGWDWASGVQNRIDAAVAR